MMLKNNILTLTDDAALRCYIELCSQFKKVDKKSMFYEVKNLIKCYKKNNKNHPLRTLEENWYECLRLNINPYFLYNDRRYLSELWACWVIYSSKYLKSIQSEKSLGNRSILSDMTNVKGIADLGCGFGYTCAALKQIFTCAKVTGTNLNNCQLKIAHYCGEQYGFSVKTEVKKIEHETSLVFASEYFEHILNPIEHLADILAVLKPKYLLIANSFGTVSTGHFYMYDHRGVKCNKRQISRRFNDYLRTCGYQKVKTNLWNSRPTYWRRDG